MFRGSSFNTIDSKGRVIIPVRFRELIKTTDSGEGVMVTAWDKCLYAYKFEDWYKLEKRILSIAETNDNMRRVKRFFVGHAAECYCDINGRILIPAILRQYAELIKDIAIVGVLDRFEIWSRENYDKENMKMEEDREKEAISFEISKLGL